MDVPLLMSNIPAFNEFFRANDRAIFFEPKQVRSLAQAIGKILVEKQAEDDYVQRIRSGAIRVQYSDATQVYRHYSYPRRRNRSSRRVLQLEEAILAGESKLGAHDTH